MVTISDLPTLPKENILIDSAFGQAGPLRCTILSQFYQETDVSEIS
jgi:hypothetical protein